MSRISGTLEIAEIEVHNSLHYGGISKIRSFEDSGISGHAKFSGISKIRSLEDSEHLMFRF